MSTILLTGAGGAAIPDLIRHLKGLGHRVLTADMDPYAPGLYLGNGGFVVPAGGHDEFASCLHHLREREAIDVVVPLVDEELMPALALRSRAQILVPAGEFVTLCLDKWHLMRQLQEIGIPVPSTYGEVSEAYNSNSLPYPWVIKPRRGRGSRGVSLAWDSEQALSHAVEIGDQYIIQEYIDEPEYTVSVVCDRHNTVHAVVPKRIIRKEGSTRLAVTERNAAIDALCRRIAEAMNPCGPFNVQLRLRDGEPYVFEINPRFSGTVNLTIAAGCDEVGGLIALALGQPYTFSEWREGVVLVRQTHDMMMGLDEFEEKTPRGWDA